MKKTSPEPIHVWLLMLRASQSITRYAAADIRKAGLGESDFRVLEVLLHKGSLPVNAIGPKVNLNPGSISVAVDRLYKKGLVSRVENPEDRRIRTVALAQSGKNLILPIFKRHCALMKHVFSDLSPDELTSLADFARRAGIRAEALFEAEHLET